MVPGGKPGSALLFLVISRPIQILLQQHDQLNVCIIALFCQLDLSEDIIPDRFCCINRFTGIFRGGRWRIRVADLNCIRA
jgi:hypothetical protein